MKYILITPAHNEEAHIEATIRAVVAQTHKPVRWVIVSDGSRDRTDEIAGRYAAAHPWIAALRLPEHRDRQFAAKVNAFNAGYARVKRLPHDIVGNLDADITFAPDYFEFLIGRFRDNPKLGVAGTPFVENGAHYDYRFTNIEHVSGACQMFRRNCFEEIGGYAPIPGGGIDWTAVTTARMKGWQTRTFTERKCFHHRTIGTGNSGRLASWYQLGRKDYFLGGHPLWELFRSAYQMTRKPYLIGGAMLALGYFRSLLAGTERAVSPELMAFHRGEQKARLKRALRRVLRLPDRSPV